MNVKLKNVFPGKVVNKRLTFNTGMDEFPRYVLEYLIDNYCREETFDQDMERVVRRLKEAFVYGAEADECIRYTIREKRGHSVIANPEVWLLVKAEGASRLIRRYLAYPAVGRVRPRARAAQRRDLGRVDPPLQARRGLRAGEDPLREGRAEPGRAAGRGDGERGRGLPGVRADVGAQQRFST